MDRKWLEGKFGIKVGGIMAARTANLIFPERDCPEDCERPCCRSSIPGGEVTVFEILLLAAFLDLSPSQFFEKYIELGIDEVMRDGMVPVPNLYRVSWHVKRPCPFLAPDGKCLVSRARPFACRLFPDAFFAIQRQTALDAERYIFDLGEAGFPCAHETPRIFSRNFLAGVHHRIKIDAAISELFFYGESPHILNVSALSGEIAAHAKANRVSDRRPDETAAYDDGMPVISVLAAVQNHHGQNLREDGFSRLQALKDREQMEGFFATFAEMEQHFTSEFSSFVVYSFSGTELVARPLFP